MLWSTKIIMGAFYVDITSQLFEKSMLVRYYQLRGLTKNLDGLSTPSHVCLAASEWTEWGCVCDCRRRSSWAVSPGCLGIWGADSTILHALTPRQAQTPFSWVFVFQLVSWWVASQICSSLPLAGICVKRPWCWPHRVPSGTPCPQAFSREGPWLLGAWQVGGVVFPLLSLLIEFLP